MESTCRGLRSTRDGAPIYRCGEEPFRLWAGVVRNGDGCPVCLKTVSAADALSLTVEAIECSSVPPDGWQIERAVNAYRTTAYAIHQRFSAQRYIDRECDDLATRQRLRRDAVFEILKAVATTALKPIEAAEEEAERCRLVTEVDGRLPGESGMDALERHLLTDLADLEGRKGRFAKEPTE